MDSVLKDTFGRAATKLRISVTDRCNFRCVYCMPLKPVWLDRNLILTFEEIEKLTRVFASLGVKSVRLTGGEPLVRHDLHILVRKLKDIRGIDEVNLTTNGFYLPDKLNQLIDSGIDRINISIDSIDPDKLKWIARSEGYDQVQQAIKLCVEKGLKETRLNAVIIRGFNEDEILDILEYGRETGFEVRFIEFMPLEGDRNWDRQKVVTEAEIVAEISKRYGVERLKPNGDPNSFSYRLEDGYIFGIIPSVSNPFCRSCNRIRITADGKFRNCLFALDETDLRTPLRDGASTVEIAGLIRKSVYSKWEGHLINSKDFRRPGRAMHQIGG